MVIRFNGRSYFPVFKRYTEVDFGGFRQVVPDYRRPGFLALLGQVESGDKPDEEIPSITTPPPTDVLDMFDDEGPGRKRFTCHAV